MGSCYRSVPTFSISPLFLLRAERVILTVTAFSSPCRRRAIRLGCRGLKEISSSGRGKRLALPFSVEISDESSTDGQPAEPCRKTWEVYGQVLKMHVSPCRSTIQMKLLGLVKRWQIERSCSGKRRQNLHEKVLFVPDCWLRLEFPSSPPTSCP